MAEVYLGEVRGYASFRKRIAVKVLHAHLASNPAMVDLFEAEARITASLDHPNIVQVHGLESAQGRLFMVAEYVPGLTLREVLTQLDEVGERLEPDLALSIAVEIGRALRHAHGDLPHRAADHPPIVHRDLSPDNVMIAEYGGVKLLDFGVAKILVGDDDADQIARGKWAYMSPEQVRGEPLDGRSDLFGLGALIYEMLTGQRAFAGATQVETMRRVEQADVAPAPGVDPLIESLLERLLARDREDRFPSASAAVVAVRQVQLHRAGIREQPELAGLVERVGRGPERARPDRPTVGLRGAGREASEGPFAVDMTSQLTIPVRGPAGPDGEGPMRPSALVEGFSAEVTDPFGADQTTLPPAQSLGGEPLLGRVPGESRVRQPGRGARQVHPERKPGPRSGELDEEDLETTAARSSSEGVLRGEEVGRPAANETLSAAARNAAEGAAEGVDSAAEISSHGPAGRSANPSVPEVFFEHFLPEVARSAEPEEEPPRWSRKNVLTLTLAILAILIAALAILLAVRQRQRGPAPAASQDQARRGQGALHRDGGPPWGSPGTARARPGFTRALAGSGGPREARRARAATAGARASVPNPATAMAAMDTAGARDGGVGGGGVGGGGVGDGGVGGGGVGEGGMVLGSMAGPMIRGPGNAGAGVRPVGLPRRGQLDVFSGPAGAVVLLDGVARGRTPVRLRAAPGRKLRLMITLPGYRLYKSPLWMPSRLGRRVRIILSPVVPRRRVARQGQTGIQVTCRPGRFNRVYLDGKDTGIDCPTPRIAVLPTVHMVSVYLPVLRRVRWKKVRPRRGQTAVVSWGL